MHPIDTPNSVGGKFSNGLPGSIPATEADADWLNAVGDELLALVVAAGLTPTKGEIQLVQAVTQLAGNAAIPREPLGSTVVDLSGPGIYTLELGGNTALTVGPAPKQGQAVLIEITGNHLLDLPAGTRVAQGRYDGSGGKLNVLVLTALDVTTPMWEARFVTIVPKKSGLLLRQAAGSFFVDETAALDTPAGTPSTAALYSRLGQLEEFRDPDTGLFRFRLVVNGTKTKRWTQGSNPLHLFKAVDDYQLVALTGGFNDTGLGGLCRSSFGGLVLDSQPGVRPQIIPLQGVFGGVGWLATSGGFYLSGDQGTTNASSVELHVDEL